jgi:flavin-dependent dehydrogenase
VERLVFERSGVRVHTSSGEVRARAVVGADGVGSFVRRALGLPRGRWQAQVVEVDTPAVAADVGRELLHFDLSDRTLLGYAWDFPTLVAGTPLVCRGLYELRPDPGDLPGAPVTVGGPDVSARLRARLERAGLASDVPLKRFSERGLSLHEPLSRPRALLVGEAAGIDPVLGEGIAQAIFYGAIAGSFLARSLDRDDLGFGDWPRELRRSRLGLDLRLRAAFLPWLYGRRRPIVEQWVGDSRDLALAGMRYFAGDHVPRHRLASAALSLGAVLASAGIAATSRWAAWSWRAATRSATW